MRAVYEASAYVLIVLGLALFAIFTIGGSVQERAGSRRDRALRRSVAPDELAAFHVYFLVPCLDEALVIGPTVQALAELEHVTVVVVDDGSSDATGAIARACGGPDVRVLRRELPDARRGKGEALNAGFAWVLDESRRVGHDPSSTAVGVLDADGRLSPGTLDVVRRLFVAEGADAVQLPVQIRNRGRLITDFQDWEFWGFSALQQHLRGAAGTVSLGGNGQFVRLDALTSLDRPPWTGSLTEDLDLALALSTRGARILSSPSGHVDQQAVESTRALLRQRTRWMQGTIECASHIPGIWMSPEIGHLAAIEMIAAVVGPVAFLLPWSIVFTVSLLSLLVALLAALGNVVDGGPGGGVPSPLGIVAWYAASFLPVVMSAWIYYRRRRRSRSPAQRISLLRVLALAHLFALYNYVNYVATWRALGRIALRRRGWAKTARRAEPVGSS